MKLQKNATLIFILIIIVSLLSTNVYSTPYPPAYGDGTIASPVDYKGVYDDIISVKNQISTPEAIFAVTDSNRAVLITSSNDTQSPITLKIGDTIKFKDLSTVGSGTSIDRYDFQFSKDSNMIESFTTKTEIEGYTYTFSQTGTYKINLCVKDNTEPNKTDYWGNWSYNGSHKVRGINPGPNITSTDDDFYGWWYFTEVVIEVTKNAPTADFKINYQGSDITDNKTSPATVDPDDKSLVLEDCSEPYSPAEPIAGRKWYYWDVNNGWKEIPGSANKATVNVDDMDAELPGSGQNKAFKLVCTSSTGGEAYEEHTAYFNKVLTSGYIIYYRDQATERDVYPAKERPGLGFGTYIEHALPAPANSELITPSPKTIILDEATPFTTFTFYYKMDNPPPPPASNPPSAILEASDEVMAGDPVKADGSKSWSNNPGGYIADYYFEFDGANLISDNGSSVRLWYPITGTYTIELEVEDENGKSDWMEREITVTPPIPTAVIDINGKLKENRKVTIDSSASTSTTYYPIDNTKTTWTITPISGGTYSDIKYSGTLNGSIKKDILFKKAGSYKIRVTVVNTYGRSVSTEKTITIAKDLPPVAKLYLPTPAGVGYTLYRDPSDSNYATIEVFNESYSSDGDIINKAVALYCYDSDNDGDYKDEQWYYSKNGTTWQTTGKNYANTVSYFNIYNIAASNISKFTLKSKNVGRYWSVIRVMEAIPAEETIPEFIMESDYKRADSFN